jgi:hypothetical protein
MTKSTITLTKKQVGNYPRIASELSGAALDIDQWEKGRGLSEKLLQQSHDIAEKMEDEGFEAYDRGQDLTIFGLHSKQSLQLPNFRNICIIPYVARKKRRSSSKELEYFLQKNPNARTWTHTTGKRCTLEELPERLEQLHAKFGRVNQQAFMKKYGARFVFRSTEFGEIAKTDEGLSFHPHAHSVLVLNKFISADEWTRLIVKIKHYFVHHSKDCGKIRSVKELVKYCVKPSDLEHLNGKELIDLHNVCTKKRLVEFLGQLRSQRKDHKDENIRLIRRKGKLTKTLNWSGSAKKPPRWLQGEQALGLAPKLVAWCAPSAIFTPITEPCFIVHGLAHRDHSKIFKWNEVIQMDNSIKVHTKTLTHQKQEIEKIKNNESEAKNREESSEIVGVPRTRPKLNAVVS